MSDTEAANAAPEQTSMQRVAVPITIEGWASAPVLYANQLQATYSGSDFIVTFAQALMPPVENPAQLESINAPVLARVVVPAAKFTEFVAEVVKLLDHLKENGALAENVAKWEGR
jgi:hypothetical protein